jgi:hypothetical protein
VIHQFRVDLRGACLLVGGLPDGKVEGCDGDASAACLLDSCAAMIVTASSMLAAAASSPLSNVVRSRVCGVVAKAPGGASRTGNA